MDTVLPCCNRNNVCFLYYLGVCKSVLMLVICISYGGRESRKKSAFFFLQYYLYSFSFLPLIIRGIQCQKQTPCLFFFFYSYYYLFIYNCCYLSFSDSAVLHSEGGVLSLVPADAYVSHRRPPAVTPLDRFQMG